MKKIHACLLGNWVCLNEDPDCRICDLNMTPYLWWEEGAPVFAPASRNENCFYELDYVNIHFKGKDYRINPVFIQIVSE